MEYEVVIGLEVHAQLTTETKIFCGCSTNYNTPPNTNVCPICLGHPGVLPSLNQRVVDFAIMAAIALKATINRVSYFARKNYFYPDLPKGYQITQYEVPFAVDGAIEIETETGTKQIRIREIHIEEDAGKLFHPESGAGLYTFVDMNRCGVPLLEIVSYPDIRSPKEASNYLKRLRQTLRYLGICAGNMEEGNFRCDANISIKPLGSEKFGTKRELKNLNSFRFLENALSWEIEYQKNVLGSGGKILQETLTWDEKEGRAIPIRSKETSSDYRYFPEPDLPPLHIEEERIEKLKWLIPELPWERETRLIRQYGIREYDAELICSERGIADYFEKCASMFSDYRTLANWITTEIFRELDRRNLKIESFPVKPEDLVELIKRLKAGELNLSTARKAFTIMIEENKTAAQVISEYDLVQISDTRELESIVDAVLSECAKELERYKAGKTSLFDFFLGQVMRKTKGKASPHLARELLKKRLEEI